MEKMLPVTKGKQIPSKIVKELLGLEQCHRFWSGAAPIEEKVIIDTRCNNELECMI